SQRRLEKVNVSRGRDRSHATADKGLAQWPEPELIRITIATMHRIRSPEPPHQGDFGGGELDKRLDSLAAAESRICVVAPRPMVCLQQFLIGDVDLNHRLYCGDSAA